MFKNIIRNNKAKNKVLSYLNKTNKLKSESIFIICLTIKMDVDLLFTISDDLETDGYVTLLSTTSKYMDGKIITITRRGRLFNKDGGYPSSGIKIIINAVKTNKATIMSVIAIIISILSYLKV